MVEESRIAIYDYLKPLFTGVSENVQTTPRTVSS